MTYPRPPHADLAISRAPKNQYGSLEETVRAIREHRPMDLSAEAWRATHPEGSFAEWQAQARACVDAGLHYDASPLDMKAETIKREERDGFILEHIVFNTTPWFRLNGYFLLPTNKPLPVPGLVVFHAWGGPMLFGRDRIVSTGKDHPVLAEHRDTFYDGRYLAEEYARAGYAVIVIDAYHFGERAPRGVGEVPEAYDPYELSVDELWKIHWALGDELYLGMRQLNWAGTTWTGINTWDDRRCVDYLQSRPEVDSDRIGCTGLSVGGWRTNMLAALEPRIKASASVGWMTCGDYQQIYNVKGAIGPFAMTPGLWDRLDIPDLTIMAAPGANLVISPIEDHLFPPEGQREAERQIRAGYEWAGIPDKFSFFAPPAPHCYNAEMQEEAKAWFGKHLG
jgi:dienelactone hydrolase